MLPVVLVRAFSTPSSCTVALRSEPPFATGSSPARALAPSGAGATGVAADLGSPNSLPRSGENHTREQEVQNMQCILTIRLGLAASLRSDHRRVSHPPLDMQSPPAVARTSARVHWLPSRHAPSSPGWRGRDKTFALPHSVPIAALHNLPFPYPQTAICWKPG